MRCKQCGEPFSKTDSFEIWEIKRQYVRPDPNGPTATVHLEDAGAFCSRNCMRDYLGPGDRSGVFNIRECDT
jgi:hypothetical protein